MHAQGVGLVCGMDEVGRGSWAGPVTVAAVISGSESIAGVRDSKVLSPARRESIAAHVRAWAIAFGIGHASHSECDALGMTAAQRLAGLRALAELERAGFKPDGVILDGKHNYLGTGTPVTMEVGADATSLAVAAASVVAKVARDNLMAAEAENYPVYEFDSNRGYPAPRHRYALGAYGPSAIHRRSWVFMESLPWGGIATGQRELF